MLNNKHAPAMYQNNLTNRRGRATRRTIAIPTAKSRASISIRIVSAREVASSLTVSKRRQSERQSRRGGAHQSILRRTKQVEAIRAPVQRVVRRRPTELDGARNAR